jgi:hypothetical protein
MSAGESRRSNEAGFEPPFTIGWLFRATRHVSRLSEGRTGATAVAEAST